RGDAYHASAAGIDADTEEMVFLGGKLKNYKDSDRTWVCDGKKWKSFPTTFDGEEAAGPFLMGGDPGAHQLLLIAYVRAKGSLSAYAYRGEGRWQFLLPLEAKRPTATAFSGSERALHRIEKTGVASCRITRSQLALPAASALDATAA